MIRNGLIASGIAAAAAVVLLASGKVSAERCALIIDGTLDRFGVFEGACPPDPAGKPTYQWLPAPIVAPPAFNSETQKLSGPDYSVGASEVTESWTLTNKTAQELDDDKQAKVDGINIAIFESLCHLKNEIRTRVQSLTAWTRAQCRNAFKALIP